MRMRRVGKTRKAKQMLNKMSSDQYNSIEFFTISDPCTKVHNFTGFTSVPVSSFHQKVVQ